MRFSWKAGLSACGRSSDNSVWQPLNLNIMPPLKIFDSPFLFWIRLGDDARKVDINFASIGVYVFVFPDITWDLRDS